MRRLVACTVDAMLRRLLAAALVVAGLAGAPAHPEPASAHVAGPPEGIQELLDRRAAAVRDGDEAAFMATVDPNAPAPFRAAQATLFAGLRSVPLARYELRARTVDTGDLGPAAAHEYPGATISLPETRQRMRVEGYDSTDAVDALWFTFVKRGERWFIADDADVADLGLQSARGLWDAGPVVTVRSEHFIVITHPGQEARAQALSAIAEEAMARMESGWDRPWPGKLPIILPASVDELQSILQSSLDLTKFVAFVAYGALRDDGFENTAPRMYIQDRNLERHSRAFQMETLAHELAHAAHAPLNGPFIPYWVHEGVADWVARGRPGGERRTGGDRTLPRDYEFSVGSSASIVRAYTEARSAVSTLHRVAGIGEPGELMTELGRIRVAPGDADYHLDAVLRRIAGFGTAELEARWGR